MSKHNAVPGDADCGLSELTVFQELVKQLSVVADPRKTRGKRYLLVEVLAIAIIGCMCGCDDAEALEDWGRKEEEWLRGLLPLNHGTPGQDVFLRVLAALDPEAFRAAFVSWVGAVFSVLGLDGQIAIDGQTHRRTGSPSTGQSPVHMVSALACEFGLVLGQVKAEAKSNEITAIPKLLRLLNLKGALVSIDAMGAQVRIAKQIVDGGGDYLLGLKGNQSNLHKETRALFDEVFSTESRPGDQSPPPTVRSHSHTDGGHGRIEVRTAHVIDDFSDWVPASERWTGLSSLIAIDSIREVLANGKISKERRFYISSRNLTPEQALSATRSHWSIENQLHWVMDLSFDQDQSRVRTKNAAENFAVIRHMALDMLRACTADKYSIPRRRRLCDYDTGYRERVLSEVITP